jgi:hypothetical protein
MCANWNIMLGKGIKLKIATKAWTHKKNSCCKFS